jgi:hypothetical protein
MQDKRVAHLLPQVAYHVEQLSYRISGVLQVRPARKPRWRRVSGRPKNTVCRQHFSISTLCPFRCGMTCDNQHVRLRLARQAAASRKPIRNAFWPGIVGRCGKTQISELAL